MDTPYNKIGAAGGLDYFSLMNDPYFLAALQSYNPNFRASQVSQAQIQMPQQTVNNSAYVTNTGAYPVDYATTKPDDSNTGLWVTGALGAAALIGLGAKGGGNPIKGAAALYEKLFKSGASKATDAIAQKLSNIRVIRNGDKVECLIPGKTQTISNKEDAINHLKQYFGISSKDLFNVTKGKSTLNGGTFVYKTGDVVTFNRNKITKIVNSKGEDITANFFGKDIVLEGDNKTFIDNLTTFITNAQKMEKGWIKSFKTADVTRELGDNVAIITYGAKKEPALKELNTLKSFDLKDNAVKAWCYDHPETKTLLGKDVFKEKNYMIPEGMKAGDVEITSKDGIVYHFKNGEIAGVTTKDGYFPKTKDECKVILVDTEQDIKTVYNQLLSGNIESKYSKMIDMNKVVINYV